MIDQQAILSSPTLPSLPTVAIELLDLTRNPETELSDIVNTVKMDPAICGKILQSANSSYFGFASQITTIDRAVPLLGTTVVTSLALSFSLADDSLNEGKLAEYYREYWLQSVIQSAAAEALAEIAGTPGLGSEYFLAGLLCDVGRLAMLQTIPREYFPVLLASKDQSKPLAEAEKEIFGFSHADISSELLDKWGLPEQISQSIRIQHKPVEDLVENPGVLSNDLAKVISVSSAIGEYYCSSAQGVALNRVRSLMLAFFDHAEQKVEQFLSQLREKIDKVGEMLSVSTSKLPSPQELMMQANQQLVNLTLKAQVANTQLAARQEVIEKEKMELENRNSQLKEMTERDGLTKIYNRAYFDKKLNQEVNRCVDLGRPIGVLFTDVDKFKNLNDTYGHQFGDVVLQGVARKIESTIRSSDVLARYGGEEFVILVNSPTEKGLERVAERVRVAVESEEFRHDGEYVPVTISIGAAIGLPGKNEIAIGNRLVTAADEAMYDSKRNGRNQVHVRSLIPVEERELLSQAMQAKFSRWLVSKEVIDIPKVSQAIAQCSIRHQPIGELAAQFKLLTQEQVDQICNSQERDQKRFGRIAIEAGLLSQPHLAFLLALQAETPTLLANTLVRLGMLSDENARYYVKQYILEHATRSVESQVLTH